ncbi:hypothetical protein O181_001244 [Austropuccinia psidii MF-1]|uniref:Uncharacterized protein n=1 Tax=Austropuccinia psidii MF-1 TaxID=1389203 RepID=A0A9Q3GBN6_9BASI|nr:hypothetical protein [Austropuccinia psidii MF-1]
MDNHEYSEDSLEDLRNKILECFKDEEFIEEYNTEEYNKADEFQICEISQDPPKRKLNISHSYENIWKAYISCDSLKERKPSLSSDSKPEENLIEVEVSPLQNNLLNSILSLDSHPQSPLRIDKEKKVY